MKNFIIAAMLGVAASAGADCAYAQSGPEVRDEFSDIQAELLRAPRVVADSSMTIKGATTTTNFGRYGFVNLTESAEPELVFAP